MFAANLVRAYNWKVHARDFVLEKEKIGKFDGCFGAGAIAWISNDGFGFAVSCLNF
jgi:hypothetical protein